MAKNIDLQLSEVTKAQLDALISGSQLSVGMRYKITDRGDKGITLTGISSNQLSLEGRRTMLCPKSYLVGSLDGNSWKGVWHSTKTVVVNDLMIWGGLVWKNLTGAIGTATTDILLDVVNWVVIPKASFIHNEYVEVIFNVKYDYANDWICSQTDRFNNEFGVTYDEYVSEGFDDNPCNMSDWNNLYEDSVRGIGHNRLVGVWNNVETTAIGYNVGFMHITRNKCALIWNNTYKSAGFLGRIDRNVSNIILGNISGSIYQNTNNKNIKGNSLNAGEIFNNTNDILSNTMLGSETSISNNTSIVSDNVMRGDYTTGRITDNTANLRNNFCVGIQFNTSTGGEVINNRISGSINNNSLGAFNIKNNINNGNINFHTLVADIEDAIVNK